MLQEFFTDEFLQRARNAIQIFSPVIGILLLVLALYFGIVRPLQNELEMLHGISKGNKSLTFAEAYGEATRVAVKAEIQAEERATEVAQLAEAQATEAALAALEATQDNEAEGESGNEAGPSKEVVAAFGKGGCNSCHVIPAIPGAVGNIGPDLSSLAKIATTRRDGYTAAEYIRESILNPEAFIAPECPAGPCPSGIMSPAFGAVLSDVELEMIVDYLAQAE